MTSLGTGATIFGCLGPELTVAERAFFRDADPFGFILFARNVETPDQLRRLTACRGGCRAQHGLALPHHCSRTPRRGY